MKYSYHPLPENYRNILSSKVDIELIIVGKDPYPTAPTGIPFCKDSWEELLRDNCSGFHVLSSLGVDLTIVKDKYSAPDKLFEALAVEGIVFLNASYNYLCSERIYRYDYRYIESANLINKPIIEKTKVCILCGQAKIMNKYTPKNIEVIEVVHPDVQCRKFYKDEWNSVWLPDTLKDTFELNLCI